MMTAIGLAARIIVAYWATNFLSDYFFSLALRQYPFGVLSHGKWPLNVFTEIDNVRSR